MSAFGLTRTTDLTLAESAEFRRDLLQAVPRRQKIPGWDSQGSHPQRLCGDHVGRRRYFPNLKSGANPAMKNREEREAINAPIQGTAADIMKIAMIRIPSALSQAGLHGKMLLQVHDELVLECPQAELAETVRHARQIMETAYPLSIPLSTEARWGLNWDELQPVG